MTGPAGSGTTGATGPAGVPGNTGSTGPAGKTSFIGSTIVQFIGAIAVALSYVLMLTLFEKEVAYIHLKLINTLICEMYMVNSRIVQCTINSLIPFYRIV